MGGRTPACTRTRGTLASVFVYVRVSKGACRLRRACHVDCACLRIGVPNKFQRFGALRPRASPLAFFLACIRVGGRVRARGRARVCTVDVVRAREKKVPGTMFSPPVVPGCSFLPRGCGCVVHVCVVRLRRCAACARVPVGLRSRRTCVQILSLTTFSCRCKP